MNTNPFTVAILAGGLATRLHPVTQTLPKALIHINGEPFINHQLRLLLKYGIRNIVMCVGYLGEMIEAHLGDGSQLGMHIQYSYDGGTLRGTGGAIKHALPYLQESFFVLYGDSYLDCDYTAIQRAFESSQQLALMSVFHNAGQWDTSNIEYQDGKIHAYDKKHRTIRMQYIDYGVGILSQAAVAQIPEDHPYDLALLYQNLLQQQQLAAYEVDKRFYEVGSFAGIKELEYYLSGYQSIAGTKM